MKNDTKSIIQAKDIYFPKRSSSDEYLENAKEYCKRMKIILPNFPAEVLSQWFYRHPKLAINDYAWLDYTTIKFFKKEWSSDLILSSGIANNKSVQIDKRNFEKNIKNSFTESIEAYFLKYNTWPIAPILLYNPDGNLCSPYGYKYSSPYHPVDGYHRLGIFLSLFKKSLIDKNKTHFLWIINTDNT